MTKQQKVALREKVRSIRDNIMRENIKIVHTGMSTGDVELDKRAGGYLTAAYIDSLLAFIEHLK